MPPTPPSEPPEPPTRRLDPDAPPPPPPARERVIEPAYEPAYERVVEPAGVDAGVVLARMEDAISSLRTALVFVGVLAVLAAGLAIYALTRDDTPARTSSGGASNERVSELDDRVDRLSRQVQQARADARSAKDLDGRVDSLSRSVNDLRGQASSASSAPDATQAIQELSKRIDDVEQRLQDLGQGQTPP